MDSCDVLVVGGGPAGSTSAWRLRAGGLDVVVLDRATFPRDKVCAGWITPQVIDDLRLDVQDYRTGRTFQPITGFRVGAIGSDTSVDTDYDAPVSFGIRRCEFDHYLLQRSGARLELGHPVASIRREGPYWIVNEAIKSPLLVGAGGHFCPVAQRLNGSSDRALVVGAQEVEWALEPDEASSVQVAATRPELYFSSDVLGYGWCFRKGKFLNIGFGRLDPRALPKATAEFVSFLEAQHRIPAAASRRWRGHAYRVSSWPRRRAVGDSVLLVGDAAGLAAPQSGEGIRPAIESGLMAASTILEAAGDYSQQRLQAYEERVRARFDGGPFGRALSRALPGSLTSAFVLRSLHRPWFVRHLLLDRQFLRAHEAPLAERPRAVLTR